MTRIPAEVAKAIRAAPFDRLPQVWATAISLYGKAALGRADRYYLLVVLLKRPDAWHPWLYARCREVEADPDGCLDLWSREHYKSSIVTFAGVIQEILNDPEITVGIFSHTRPNAVKFLIQIKEALETNTDLQALYPDVLWAEPTKEAPRWSIEKGIVVKRQSNPKEATIEASGLVDGQPTGAHYALRVYDDVVVLESVSTPAQVEKTTNAWALSDNLGARGADGMSRAWHLGTRYNFADSYQYMLDKKILKPRIYPATDDGTVTGNPVFLTHEAWAAKVKTQPLPILAAQMLQNPSAGNQAMFRKEWLKYSDIRPATLNVYILCDPAGSRKVGTDRTAIAAVGYDAQRNKWLLDGFNHKMSLRDRWLAIRDLRKKWANTPGVQLVKVGYERYGMDSDIEYFTEQMQMPGGESFEVMEVAWPRDGTASKEDRVQRLEPDFRMGRFYLPMTVEGETANQRKLRESGQPFRIFSPIRRPDEDGQVYSLTERFEAQYLHFPFSTFKDLIDAISRIYDMEPTAPILIDESLLNPEVYCDGA